MKTNTLLLMGLCDRVGDVNDKLDEIKKADVA
jgi:hypothetical protein